MGGHDDETTSARGIVDGGEDDGVRYSAAPRESLHKFTPSHVMSDGRGYDITDGTYLTRSKGKPRT